MRKQGCYFSRIEDWLEEKVVNKSSIVNKIRTRSVLSMMRTTTLKDFCSMNHGTKEEDGSYGVTMDSAARNGSSMQRRGTFSLSFGRPI